jgi:hypothetical protein
VVQALAGEVAEKSQYWSLLKEGQDLLNVYRHIS